MATPLQHFKVPQLPVILSPDSVYYVRSQTGQLRAFVTDNAGVPTPVAAGSPADLLSYTGRLYFYSDARWVTPNDANYGPAYYQWNETCGTAADPTIRPYRKGTWLKAGTKIKDITVGLRVNTNSTTNGIADVEFLFGIEYPTDPVRFLTGADNNNEMSRDQILRSAYYSPGGLLPTITSPKNDETRRFFSGLDYVTQNDGMFFMAAKPTRAGTGTSTRYGLCEITVDLELP